MQRPAVKRFMAYAIMAFSEGNVSLKSLDSPHDDNLSSRSASRTHYHISDYLFNHFWGVRGVADDEQSSLWQSTHTHHTVSSSFTIPPSSSQAAPWSWNPAERSLLYQPQTALCGFPVIGSRIYLSLSPEATTTLLPRR